jgi:hypothetical protein
MVGTPVPQSTLDSEWDRSTHACALLEPRRPAPSLQAADQANRDRAGRSARGRRIAYHAAARGTKPNPGMALPPAPRALRCRRPCIAPLALQALEAAALRGAGWLACPAPWRGSAAAPRVPHVLTARPRAPLCSALGPRTCPASAASLLRSVGTELRLSPELASRKRQDSVPREEEDEPPPKGCDDPRGAPSAWVRRDHLLGGFPDLRAAFPGLQQLQSTPRKSALQTQRRERVGGVSGARRWREWGPCSGTCLSPQECAGAHTVSALTLRALGQPAQQTGRDATCLGKLMALGPRDARSLLAFVSPLSVSAALPLMTPDNPLRFLSVRIFQISPLLPPSRTERLKKKVAAKTYHSEVTQGPGHSAADSTRSLAGALRLESPPSNAGCFRSRGLTQGKYGKAAWQPAGGKLAAPSPTHYSQTRAGEPSLRSLQLPNRHPTNYFGETDTKGRGQRRSKGKEGGDSRKFWHT